MGKLEDFHSIELMSSVTVRKPDQTAVPQLPHDAFPRHVHGKIVDERRRRKEADAICYLYLDQEHRLCRLAAPKNLRETMQQKVPVVYYSGLNTILGVPYYKYNYSTL